MKTNDMEKMLSPKCTFRASDDLKKRILAAAEAEILIETETAPEMKSAPKTPRVTSWWHIPTSLVAAAACIAVVLFVRPSSTPLYAAESLDQFRKAAELLLQHPAFTASFEVRTRATENFSYMDPRRRFVEHTLTVMPGSDEWILEKSGRKALCNGEYIWQWIPEYAFGWKYDPWDVGVIEAFAYLLDPYTLLRSEEALAREYPQTVIRKSEKKGILTLTVEAPAEGDYTAGNLRKHSSIAESDTRREYTFDSSSGQLLSLKISAKVFGIRRTIVKMTAIDYSTTIDPIAFVAPEHVEWVDFTREGMERAAQTLPVDEFRNISPEAAVEKMFAAMHDWDHELLDVVLYGSNQQRLKEIYKGCELLEIGDSFRSGVYAGVFVPCRVRRADGKIEKLRVALRSDRFFGAWTNDGGL